MKDLTKYLPVRELIKSLKLLRKYPFFLIIAAFIDAAFFFVQAFLKTPVSDQIAANTVLIGNKLSPLLAAQETGLLAKLFTGEFKPLTGKLIVLILLYFFIVYIVYVIFHGTTWFLASRIAEQKTKYRKYFWQFAKINIFWLGLFVLWKLLDILVGLRRVVIDKFAPGTPNIMGGMLMIALVILCISAVFSYPRFRKKEFFAMPIKTTIPVLILAATSYLVPLFVVNTLGRTPDTAILLGIIILFPAMVLVKVYLTRVITHVRTRD